MDISFILVVIALVLFAIAALAVPVPRIDTIAAGLFCWLLSTVV